MRVSVLGHADPKIILWSLAWLKMERTISKLDQLNYELAERLQLRCKYMRGVVVMKKKIRC